MCMRSTPVQWRDKHNRDFNKVTEATKSGSYTIQRLTSPLHDDRRATTPRQQGNLRLTQFQCSQYTWSRNQGNVTSSHAADSVTFAERVGNSKSRPWSMIHMNCDRCSQIQKRSIGNTFVRTSRFTVIFHCGMALTSLSIEQDDRNGM